jgi:hypothetical protein
MRLSFTQERRTELVSRMKDVEARLPEANRIERVRVLSALADDACHKMNLEAALDYSERALVLAQTVDGEAAVRPAAASRAFALMQAGRHFEARLFLDAGIDLARRGGGLLEQARAFNYFGVSVIEDDPRAALAAMLECATLAGQGGVRPLQGQALANASEGAADLGEWDLADRALADMALLTRDNGNDEDGAVLTAAMLTAHRGDPAAALAALADLEADGRRDWDLVQMRTWFLRVQALCLFLRGDAGDAAEAALASIAIEPAGGNAPTSLWTAVQAASARRDVAMIRTTLETTSALRGQWTALVRGTALAAIACLDDMADAASTMGDALNAWSAANLPLDHAYATLCALHVMPTSEVPVGHVDRARAYLTELRATSLLKLYDAVSAAQLS